MPLLHSFLRAIDRASPVPVAHAPLPQKKEFHSKIARYTATKEQHAEVYKSEVRILWADYFKPEHLQQFPQLHDLVWKALKAGSKARQEVNLKASEDMLKHANEIAEIFWKTKGVPTIKAKAPYPTGRETVYPSLG